MYLSFSKNLRMVLNQNEDYARALGQSCNVYVTITYYYWGQLFHVSIYLPFKVFMMLFLLLVYPIIFTHHTKYC